jgi:hypothetical protein
LDRLGRRPQRHPDGSLVREVAVAIDEQRMRIRRSLEEKLGVEEASYLMDRPVGGWSELVTNHTLDLKVEVLDERFRGLDAKFDAIDARLEAIDARFEALDAKFDAKFEAFGADLAAQMHREFRNQTWKFMTALVATMTMLIALFGVILAIGSGS